jgi:hypothetical protein
MLSWADFAAEVPHLEAFGRRRLERRIGYLATSSQKCGRVARCVVGSTSMVAPARSVTGRYEASRLGDCAARPRHLDIVLAPRSGKSVRLRSERHLAGKVAAADMAGRDLAQRRRLDLAAGLGVAAARIK